MVIMIRSRRTTTVIPVAADVVPVAFKKTYINGKPVEEDRASETLPMQNKYVRRSANVIGTFSRNVQTMLFGTIMLAFSISSDMWATESEPEEVMSFHDDNNTSRLKAGLTKYGEHGVHLTHKNGPYYRRIIRSIVRELGENGRCGLFWCQDKQDNYDRE